MSVSGLPTFLLTLTLIAAAVAVVIGWVGSWFELHGVARLDPAAFDGGPLVLARALTDLQQPGERRDPAAVRTRSGSFRQLASGRILFAPRVFPPAPLLNLLNLGVYKGSIFFDGDTARATVRAPWSTTLRGAMLVLLLLGLAGALSLGAGECSVTTATGKFPISCGLPVAVLVAGCVCSAWAQRRWTQRRALRMLDEIRSALLVSSPPASLRRSPSGSR